jgi:hypothetical protein
MPIQKKYPKSIRIKGMSGARLCLQLALTLSMLVDAGTVGGGMNDVPGGQ